MPIPTSNRLAPLMSAILLAALAVPGLAEAGNCKHGEGAGTGIDKCLILWADEDQVQALAQAHGLTVVRPIDPGRGDVVLAEGPGSVPIESTLENLAADPEVLGVERASVASLSEAAADAVLGSATLAALESLGRQGSYSGPEVGYFLGSAWNGYLDQPAAAKVSLGPARIVGLAETFGTGIVAVIDTGVDPDHPLLQGALVSGYDFLLDQPGSASEWAALDPAWRDAVRNHLEAAADQSYSGILEGNATTVLADPGVEVLVDQSYSGILEQSYSGILEQSYSGILEHDDLPSAFGHGTMVAGLVRLVAPGAKIMPLRVFDGDGTASLFDIVRAIYYAADQGAKVINMSFSTDTHSPELAKALKYAAKQKGAVLVSSSGNYGTQALTYPAASGHVVGVASTDLDDARSEFSSFGSSLVTLAAPGEAVVTLYPGGLYAAAWGTSFSAALVSGAVALLNKQNPNNLVTIKPNKAECALEAGAAPSAPPSEDLGSGRLHIDATVDHGLLLETANGPCS